MAFSSPLALSKVGGAALQAAESLGQKTPQGIRGFGQAAQFIAAAGVHLLAEVAVAELGNVFDQLANRGNQAAVDQPQAEQADQGAGDQHHGEAKSQGLVGGGTDRYGLLVATLAELAHQGAHLFAGGAVDALDRCITGGRVGTGCNERLVALAVGRTHAAVFVAQLFDLLLERAVLLLVGADQQFAEDALHPAFLGLELAPVLVPLRRVLAAQQNVLPFLDLHLEFDVGPIDQPRGVQRAIDQPTVGLDAVGQKAETGQGDQQDQRQADTQQGENLRTEGRLQGHGIHASEVERWEASA